MFVRITSLLVALLIFNSCLENQTSFEKRISIEDGYEFESVTNDPSNTRIYTLDNGLKVYISKNTLKPRIHVRIAVKTGSRNDPAEHTGLSHYLEHMMFKGSDEIGTIDWQSEQILLDSIENMFEVYATLRDSTERLHYFRQIDSVSNQAAKYAIPTEYDKMVSLIGGSRVNAGTGEDKTVFWAEIPSNELARYLKIEGNRFSKLVPRLFHTELESVYEEKNMDDDWIRSMELLASLLFSKHPYGSQNTIGKTEDLKNPSIKAIKEHFSQYYVANNMAICLSGDVDFLETITFVDKYFGKLRSKPLAPLEFEPEEPMIQPIETEFYGPDPEFFVMGFRFPFARNSHDNLKMKLVDMLLANGVAGLIDIYLEQEQKVAFATCYPYLLDDYSIHMFEGEAKPEQTLDQVKNLILEQLEKLKNGQFDESLIYAVITDFNKKRMEALRDNEQRTEMLVEAFAYDVDWATRISEVEIMSEITKEEIVEFVRKYYQNNYAIVYKKEGKRRHEEEIPKPPITNLPINRDRKSEFYKEVESMTTNDLKVSFLNFSDDVKEFQISDNLKLISIENKEDGLFHWRFLFDEDKVNDPVIRLAIEYLPYIRTPEHNTQAIRKKLYALGCGGIETGKKNGYYFFEISGLVENLNQTIDLLNEMLTNPVSDEVVFEKFVENLKEERLDMKKNKNIILHQALLNYAKYGNESPFTYYLRNDITSLTAKDLISIIKTIPKLEQKVTYYGPDRNKEIQNWCAKLYQNSNTPTVAYKNIVFKETATTADPYIFKVNLDMPQYEVRVLKRSFKYGPALQPLIALYNQYFNSIIYEELRELRGYAYATRAKYNTPSKPEKFIYLSVYLGTQNDKLVDAMGLVFDLFKELPESIESFEVSKKFLLRKLESERVNDNDKAWEYIVAKDLGNDYDIRKDIYEKLKDLTLDDLVDFHETYVKLQSYKIVIIGPKDEKVHQGLEKFGVVNELELEQIF